MKLLEITDLQRKKLELYINGTYEVDKNNLINVTGDINMPVIKFTKLPFKFGTVSGNFNLWGSKLKTLEGCPHTVGGLFSIMNCTNLYSLDFCPKKAGGFSCSRKSDKPLDEDFDKLPDVINDLILENWRCKKLGKLPSKLKGSLALENFRALETLEGCPTVIGRDLNLSGTWSLKSFKGCPTQMDGNISISHSGAKNTLHLLKIKGVKQIFSIEKSPEFLKILNKHIKTRDIMACQDELIDAGFEEYAKL